jgi:hypothetical protein
MEEPPGTVKNDPRESPMRTTIAVLLVATLASCGGKEPESPPGPRFLNTPPEAWAEAITVKEMREKQAALNRLALGRTDAVPVLIALLAWDDPEVVSGAYLALETNLAKTERNNGDPAPWIPAFEAATKCEDPGIVEDATEILERIRPDR